MPSFAATVLFLPLVGLCWARHVAPMHRPQPSTSPSLATQPNSTKSVLSSVITSIASPTTSIPQPNSTKSILSSIVSIASPTTSIASQVSASGTAIPPGFVPGVKWQIEIQDPIDLRKGLQPADAKVVDVDLFLASKDPTLIPALHAAGATVLCYFNAGAVQTTDCDWAQWNAQGLFKGRTVSGYSQEKYVDITSDAVVQLHKARIDLALSIGCDGLDPDNIDTYDLSATQSIGKKITQADMITFLGKLATYAHSKTTKLGHTLMIGQKNAAEITDRISTFMDFAISENCLGSPSSGGSDEFCSDFQKYYANNGKPVFDIGYPSSLASSSKLRRATSQGGCSTGVSAGDKAFYCPTTPASNAGISRILKLDNNQYGLNGCTQYCTDAMSFVMPTYESNSTNSC